MLAFETKDIRVEEKDLTCLIYRLRRYLQSKNLEYWIKDFKGTEKITITYEINKE